MAEEKKDILDNLKKAVFEYDRQLAARSAVEAVEKGIDPIEAMNVMTTAIREIGLAFGKGELWLPELVGASDAMQGATPILEEEMKRKGRHRESLGMVVAGTVFGDIHSIGKTMVPPFSRLRVSASKIWESMSKQRSSARLSRNTTRICSSCRL